MASSIASNCEHGALEVVNTEQSGFTKKMWADTKCLTVPNVLDPDDSLMNKFQSALREHLVRVDNKLNSEILDLVSLLLF